MSTDKGRLLAQGRTAEIYAWGEAHVLKLFRHPWPTAAEREVQIARLAYACGVLTPRAYEMIEIEQRPGIVFERVNGPSLLTVLAAQPWRAPFLARAFAELHATLHQVRAPALRMMRDVLRAEIQQAPSLPAALQQATLNVLQQLPDDDKLCHGDFHPDNIIVTPAGLVLVDWANAVCGDPLADVARTTVLFQFGQLPPDLSITKRWLIESLRTLFRTVYVNRYFQINPLPRQQWPRWRAVIAAARLNERIEGEQARLTKFIQTQLNKKDFLYEPRQPT